ncbi:hypothetical protein PanWU01x14_154140 [Parasponia andersonii]|uniref:RNase H type-1 domain-containing protein n=1 Tax=Parasponia andersonii TaxID=3476 RepID=A0A2P5CGR7_PARAD|nr:hypothetical protein PanWU01x14_154140 [Parasponia andersonii]
MWGYSFYGVAVILDFIWRTHNDVMHNNAKPNPAACLASCFNRVNEFLIHEKRTQTNISDPSYSSCMSGWIKPPDGVIKVNVDAAISGDLAYLGVVARNSMGEIISMQAFKGPCSSIEVAVLKGAELAASKNWSKVMFEGDCLNVFKALNGDFDGKLIQS